MRALPARLLLAALLLAAGCATLPKGKLAAVGPVGGGARVGRAYLVRGWMGVFSKGLPVLKQRLADHGVEAQVFLETQWHPLADALVDRYRAAPNPEPLILIGHSWGADDVLHIARQLDAANVPVDLIVTLDPVTPPRLPPNVRRCVNLYETNGIFDLLPAFRGVPIRPDPGAAVALHNVDIRRDRRDLLAGDGADLHHWNMDAKPPIQREIVAEVLKVCPPRARWARRPATRPSTAPASYAVKTLDARP